MKSIEKEVAKMVESLGRKNPFQEEKTVHELRDLPILNG
jgi:hypothetical protein